MSGDEWHGENDYRVRKEDTVSDVLKAFEDEALGWLEELRAYRVYQGQNPEYKAKAKIGVGAIGAYVRLRATMANEKQIQLIERRMDDGLLPSGN